MAGQSTEDIRRAIQALCTVPLRMRMRVLLIDAVPLLELQIDSLFDLQILLQIDSVLDLQIDSLLDLQTVL